MLKTRTIFQVLAIFALSLQMLGHLSPVLAEIDDNWQIQICSGPDIRTITIDKDGNQLPETPQMRTHKCAFCTAASASAIITQQYLQQPPVILRDTPVNSDHASIASTPKHKTNQTRAPPQTS